MDETKITDKPSYFKKLMLHEYCLFAFMLEMVLRLSFRPNVGALIVYYFIAASSYIGFIFWGIKSKSIRVNRVRLFVSFIVMNFCYNSIKYVIPALGIPIMDKTLSNIDKVLVGGDLSLLAQNIYSRPLTEIMSIGYTLHFVPLFSAVIYYAFFSDTKKSYIFYNGLFSVLAIGFVGYSLVPANGPLIYFSGQYTKELVGYWYTAINSKIVGEGSPGFDVFPSMHVGVATFLLLFFSGYNKKAFKFYIPLYIVIVCSTIYLRYHYFIDIVCGALLSITSYYLCSKLAKSFDEGKDEHELYNGISEAS